MHHFPRVAFRVACIGMCFPLLLLAAGGRGLGQPAQTEVTLKVVNYDGLGEIIRNLRGKVVIVDVWSYG